MGEPEAKREVPPGASPISGLPPPVHTRWKPGQSGNPGGRPKGRSIVASLREVLEREHNGRRIADLIAERLAKEALAGKFPFLKEILDRVDGPTAQRVQVEPRTGEQSPATIVQTIVMALPPEHRAAALEAINQQAGLPPAA